MRQLRFVSVALVVLLGAVRQAGAGPIITYEFTGRVTLVTGPMFGGVLNPSLNDPVSGSFSYDLMAPDLASDPETGLYWQTITKGLRVSVGAIELASTSDYRIRVVNQLSPTSVDQFSIALDGDALLNSSPVEAGIVMTELRADPGDVFTSDALPPTLDLSDFNQVGTGSNVVENAEDTLEYFHFTITSLTATGDTVPEPSTLAMFSILALGFTCFGLWRRGRVYS